MVSLNCGWRASRLTIRRACVSGRPATPQEFVGAYQRQQAAGVNSGADGVGAPSIKPSPSRRKGLGSESDGEIEEYPSEEEVFDEL